MTQQELQKIIKDISFRDWEFHISGHESGFLLQVQFLAPDSLDPTRVERQFCRQWYISTDATPTDVVRTAWKAVEAAVLHEAQELFLYRGSQVYSPHLYLEGAGVQHG